MAWNRPLNCLGGTQPKEELAGGCRGSILWHWEVHCWPRDKKPPTLAKRHQPQCGPGPEPQGSNDKRLVQAPGKGPTTKRGPLPKVSKTWSTYVNNNNFPPASSLP